MIHESPRERGVVVEPSEYTGIYATCLAASCVVMELSLNQWSPNEGRGEKKDKKLAGHFAMATSNQNWETPPALSWGIRPQIPVLASLVFKLHSVGHRAKRERGSGGSPQERAAGGIKKRTKS